MLGYCNCKVFTRQSCQWRGIYAGGYEFALIKPRSTDIFNRLWAYHGSHSSTFAHILFAELAAASPKEVGAYLTHGFRTPVSFIIGSLLLLNTNISCVCHRTTIAAVLGIIYISSILGGPDAADATCKF